MVRRLLVIAVFGLRYKLQISGVENLPREGPVMLLGNHISYIDWVFAQWATPRTIHFVMHEDYYNIPLLRWFWRAIKIICVNPSSSRNALRNIVSALENKQMVGIFPEGEISRTGNLLQLKRGFEKILSETNTDVTVLPFVVENMWGSLLSKAPKEVKASQRFFFRRKVHIHFGKDLGKNIDRTSLEKAMLNMLD